MWMSLARFSTACGDHGVHQADDRRLAGHVAQVLEVLAGFAVVAARPRGGLLRLAVVLVDGVEDLLLGRQRGLHLQPGERRAPPRRVSKSSGSAMASVRVESCSATGRQRNCRRKRGERPSVSGATGGGPSIVTSGMRKLFGERRQHVAHGDEAQIDQDLADLVAALLLHFERAVQVFGVDLPRSMRISPRRG